MKKILFLFVMIANVWFVSAQYDMYCRLGFSYEISNNNQWGKNKPIIMKVYQNSPAEKAGIKQNDIIEEIDDYRVDEISLDDVDSLLTASGSLETKLVIRNFSDQSRSILIQKECMSIDAFTESRLAEAFSMYSIENTHDRLFVCPFTTSVTRDEIDFTQYKTFDFVTLENLSFSQIESSIIEILKTELTKKGLRYSTLNPDFIINTHYTFDKNPNFRRRSRETENQAPIFRYDINRDQIIQFPFHNMSVPESEAEYILQLGVRFIDQKQVRGRVLWECEANELMYAPYSINDYAAIHLPLMCMQFPYIKYNRNAQFILTKKAYNYTGINYNIYKINEVVEVDYDSPAFEAGIRAGDIIERIENKRIDFSPNEFTTAYRVFISKSLKYRDKGTQFTDSNGFSNCMFWDTFKYTQIAKIIKNDKYKTGFSYLYAFAPYINPERNSFCTFNVRRNGEKMTFVVRPTFYSEKTIELN
jgi:Periplasmic protease